MQTKKGEKIMRDKYGRRRSALKTKQSKKPLALPRSPRQSAPGPRLGTPGKPQEGLKEQRMPFKKGGALRPVDKNKNPGLAKLPTKVRNKMGFMKDGGIAKRNKASKAIFRNIKTKDAFKKASGKK